MTCAGCGEQAPDGARFCPACGAPLAPAPSGERRLATILFADLVGSTALTVGLDPEDARALLERYYDVARAVLAEHGGTLEKFVGDAVLAAFGVPRSHGDDPDRAVRAGLELAERVAALGPQYAVRVGIATGEVLVAAPGGDLDLTGEAVNAAARIEQAAQRSQVLVDERTARACQVAELRTASPIDAKGFVEPLAVHEAVAARRGARALLDTPLIGRDDDLVLVELLVRRASSGRVPALITVVGEAGLGKTRLLREALARLRAGETTPMVLSGRSPSYGRGVAFWAVGEVLREVAGAAPDAAPDVVLGALRTRLAGLGADDAGDLAADLVVAVGAAEDAAGPVVERLRRAWRRMLGLLATCGPVILALDDVHWADDGTLDLIEDAMVGVGDLPLAILCTARPELLERRPAWAGGLRGSGAVHLAPLAGPQARELAAVLLRDTGVASDTGVAERIAALAAGNPFFTEELACNPELLAGDGGALPDSVQGAVIARLDQLAAGERRTLQAAAVLGVRFSADAVAALTGADPGSELDGLARSAVIVAEPQEGAGLHAFRHQILRDVAYGTLPRPARADLHERAASWTTEHAGERLPELSEIIAYHRERAAELTGDEERRRLAAQELLGAAWNAALRGAVGQADALFDRSAAIAPEVGLAVRAHREAAEVALWAGMRGDLALDHERRAAELARAAGEPRLEATALAAMVELHRRYSGIVGPAADAKEAAALLARATELAGGADAVVLARVAVAEAWVATDVAYDRGHAGEPGADVAIPAAERACELAQAADDPVLLSSALDALAAAQQAAGWPQRAAAATLRRRALAPRLRAPGAPGAERFDALNMIAEALESVGDFGEALAAARDARAAALERGLDHSAYTRLAGPLFELGGWDELVEEVARFRAGWEAAERPPAGFARTSLAIAIAVPALRGDERTLAEWSAAWDQLQEGGRREGQSVAWPGNAALVVSRARVALQQGRLDDAGRELAWEPREVSAYVRPRYGAHCAEAAVRAGAAEAAARLVEAGALAEGDRFAEQLVARAHALHEGDADALLAAHAGFGAIGARYEQARTGVDLGGEDAGAGRAFLAGLGIPV